MAIMRTGNMSSQYQTSLTFKVFVGEIYSKSSIFRISPMIFYRIITGFIGAFKAYSDAVALFGTNLNAAEMNTIVGYIYDMLYGDSGGYPSYASAAAILRCV